MMVQLNAAVAVVDVDITGMSQHCCLLETDVAQI